MDLVSYLKVLKNWYQREKKFLKFLKRNLTSLKASNEGNDIAVLVCPWVWTTVPWYAITLGLLLSEKKRVTFIIDDVFNGPSRLSYGIQLKSIKSVSKLLKGKFKIVFLSEVKIKSSGITHPEIVDFCEWNTIHEMRGESLAREERGYFNKMLSSYERAYPYVYSLLKESNYEYVLLPGGIKNSSGVFNIASRNTENRFCSFDSGPADLLIASNGIAAHLYDIKEAYLLYKSEFKSVETARQKAIEETNKRLGGTSYYSYLSKQDNPKEYEVFENSVLIALNSSWDSAALGLHTVFKDSIEWIVESIKYILENTDKKVVIRQHPVEKYDFASTTDDYKEIIKTYFGDNDRVIVVDAHSKVNTYKLFKYASAMLAYTSTVGIEATMVGLPVISESKNYYADFGFVFSGTSKGEYFNLIKKACNKELKVTEEMVLMAQDCYFLTQLCNWSFSDFNPCVNFEDWVSTDLESIKERNDVEQIVQSIDENIPFSWIKSQKFEETM